MRKKVKNMNSLFLVMAMSLWTACSSSSEISDDKGGKGNLSSEVVDSTSYKPMAKNTPVTNYDGYSLIWHDEFDIDGIPGKEWSYEEGFQRNNELQWYQNKNATVSGGCLVIEGRKERVVNPNYVADSGDWKLQRKYAEFTSSSVTTKNSFSFQFGRIEVRAKIPTTSGSWPAIWLLGDKWEWPNNGEVDILEFYIKNGRPSILANACWGDNGLWKAVWNEAVTPYSHFTSKDKDWAQKFHVWRMDWDENYMSIYVDGELLNKIDLATTYNKGYGDNFENPFTSSAIKHYIILNLAIGSNGGTPDLSHFPLKYNVDYVRVYHKN